MLLSGCQRLGARLCCMRSGLRASEGGRRNLVSCIDRKARPRVQVFGTREGPRSALSTPGALHRGHSRPGSPGAVTPGQVTQAGRSWSARSLPLGGHPILSIWVASLAALTL